MTEDQKQELKDNLLDAQEHLFEAIELLKGYVQATDDQNAKAYLVDHLEIMASDGHSFLSNDLNIDKIVERLDENEDG